MIVTGDFGGGQDRDQDSLPRVHDKKVAVEPGGTAKLVCPCSCDRGVPPEDTINPSQGSGGPLCLAVPPSQRGLDLSPSCVP